MKFTYAERATPFNQDDIASLIPQHIKTQKALNEWEQANIVLAERWLFSRRKKDFLTLEFIQKLHHKMFDKTWLWAGQFRRYQTNIGVTSSLIAVSVKTLCDDVNFWLQRHTYPFEEMVVRFHHRLVQIHAFPNGNGRHARLMADLLLVTYEYSRFSWGSKDLTTSSEIRKRYITALQKADQGDFTDLINFVRR